MKKVLAISGGVDSMLLLWQYRDDKDVVVAHFDHGTRPSSEDDAKFVEATAKKYGLTFFLGKAELGEDVSEAAAREARYAFLKNVAKKVDGKIYTAHHLNDLAESVAINFLRGTGWRGLTPFSDSKITRPFLNLTKKQILAEAAKNQIVFRQDPTNAEDKFLRNLVREKVAKLSEEQLLEIYNLFIKQNQLRNEIEKAMRELIPSDRKFSRKWFCNFNNSDNTNNFSNFDGSNEINNSNDFVGLDEKTAIEFLRIALLDAGISATGPQIFNFLDAIKTYEPHKKFNLPNDKLITIYKDYFVL